MGRMVKIGVFLGIAVAALAAGVIPGEAQLASPTAKAACKFADGKTVSVNYSSPRRRGRKIFGGLVPYGEVWRAGADDATSFVPNVDVGVGGRNVPAGRYTLFTLPAPDKWTLIVSRKIGEWGIPYPGEKFDFARMEMKVSRLSSPLENFTISFDQTGTGCTMRLDWETTRASIDIAEKK
ncbi:MAG: DUF2911 domain-containing protein [Candidatus Acidiferrales bacterium]